MFLTKITKRPLTNEVEYLIRQLKVRIKILASDLASKLYIPQVSVGVLIKKKKKKKVCVGVNQIWSSRFALRGGKYLMLPSLSEKTTLQSLK